MHPSAFTCGKPTTTQDAPQGIPLYLHREGDGYFVRDMVGLRYGCGATPAEALDMWSECVADILETESAGQPLLGEIERYREALRC